MVYRVWILLILCACPAEQLGIQLPKRGVQAISQSDVKRDIWSFSDLSKQETFILVGERLTSMNLELEEVGSVGQLCASRKGKSQLSFYVIHTSGIDGAIRIAALISLAKSMSINSHSLRFCLASTENQELGWEIQSFSGSALSIDKQNKKISTERQAVKFEDINFRRMTALLRNVSRHFWSLKQNKAQ